MTRKKEIGARLAALRQARGLTQAQMAELLGASRSGYIKWEQGERCPDLEAAWDLAEILGVSLDRLAGLDGSKVEIAPANAPRRGRPKKRA